MIYDDGVINILQGWQLIVDFSRWFILMLLRVRYILVGVCCTRSIILQLILFVVNSFAIALSVLYFPLQVLK